MNPGSSQKAKQLTQLRYVRQLSARLEQLFSRREVQIILVILFFLVLLMIVGMGISYWLSEDAIPAAASLTFTGVFHPCAGCSDAGG